MLAAYFPIGLIIIMKLNAKRTVDVVRFSLARRQNEGIKSFRTSSRHTNRPFDRLFDKTKFEVSGVFLVQFLRAVLSLDARLISNSLRFCSVAPFGESKPRASQARIHGVDQADRFRWQNCLAA